MSFNFNLKTEIVFAPGAIDKLHERPEVSGKRCMLLCFPQFDKESLVEDLNKSCEFLLVPDKFEENPAEELVRELASLISENRIDSIIAIGGGSSIDAAKGAAWFACNPEWNMNGENASIIANILNIVAVPTTSGTGSEVTPYSILTCSDHRKRILNHPSLVPCVALCDPSLTVSMPKGITANTGIDAISHAIEAYLNNSCNHLLADIAEIAIRRGSESLPTVIENGKEIAARGEMMQCALGGGIVLAHCGTVLAHALGYCVTRVFGFPHGKANAVFLSALVDLLAEKGCERAIKVKEIFSGDLAAFIKNCGIDTTAPAISDEEMSIWIEEAFQSYGRKNSRTEITREDIEKIIYKSINGNLKGN